MKILVLGMMGAGKSTIAYEIQKSFGLKRLNLDEVSRNPKTGDYYSKEKQNLTVQNFLNQNDNWVMEGSQKHLYQMGVPDVIIYADVSRITAIYRFTNRFFKARKLIGTKVHSDNPVQAYHYRKPTIRKILDWDQCNKEIKNDIEEFLKDAKIPIIKTSHTHDWQKVIKEMGCKKRI